MVQDRQMLVPALQAGQDPVAAVGVPILGRGA